MRKIRILHLSPNINFGGAELLIYNLSKHINPEEFTPIVASWHGGRLECRLREQGIQTIRINANPRTARLKSIRKILYDQKIDILHTHLFIGGLYGRLAAATATHVGVIRTHHGLTFQSKKYRRVICEKLLKPQTDCVVAVSDAVKNHVTKTLHWHPDSVIVIPNGIEMKRFILHREKMNDVPIIVSTGRLSQEKGYPILIQALKILKNQGIQFKCIIAGDGPEQNSLKALVLRLELQADVDFYGYVENVALILKSGDIFVLPSFQEGLPLSLLEAMAASLPVVASAVGGMPEMLTPDIGWIVEPGNPDALAKIIFTVLNDPVAALKKAKRGQAKVMRKYTIENTVSGYDILYRKIYEFKR